MSTYFIQNADEIQSADQIRHYDLHAHHTTTTVGWLPANRPLEIALTCGASCPDAVVDRVLLRTLSFFQHITRLRTSYRYTRRLWQKHPERLL